MRLTNLANRLTLAAATPWWRPRPVARGYLYLDTSKVPHDMLGTIPEEDRAVKRATFTGTPHRQAEDRQAEDHRQPRGRRDLGAHAPGGPQDRPRQLRGRPRDLAGCPGHPGRRLADAVEHRGRGRHRQLARLGHAGLGLHDPAIQETQIAQALSTFDTTWTTSMLWGHSLTPLNNAITAGTILTTKFPIIFDQDTGQFSSGLQKRTCHVAVLQVQQNVQYAYSNSPGNVFPSAYTLNLQFQFTQPLLGGTARARSARREIRANIVIARLTPTPLSGTSKPRSWPMCARSSSSTGLCRSSRFSSGVGKPR